MTTNQQPAGAAAITASPEEAGDYTHAQILTIPGEALPNIGFYLKRKMRGKHHLLFGYLLWNKNVFPSGAQSAPTTFSAICRGDPPVRGTWARVPIKV